MRIYDIVTEAKVPPWIDDALERVGIKLPGAAGRAAERALAKRIAEELARLEPFLDDVSTKFADKVVNNRTRGIKDPDPRNFVDLELRRRSGRALDTRHPKEQEAIVSEITKRAQEKLNARSTPAPSPSPAPSPAPSPSPSPTPTPGPRAGGAAGDAAEELARLEREYPGIRASVRPKVDKIVKRLGQAQIFLWGLGLGQIIIEFLQDSAMIDQAMVDEKNPMSPEEANILHQRVQANFYLKLATLPLAAGVIRALGLTARVFPKTAGALIGTATGYALASALLKTDLIEDEKLKAVARGAVQGGIAGAGTGFLIELLYKKLGINFFGLFSKVVAAGSTAPLATWLTSADGREFINGIVRWSLEAPGGLPEDETMAGKALNAFRGFIPDEITEYRRAAYKIIWYLAGPDSLYDKAFVQLFPPDIQKWLNLNPDIPPVGSQRKQPDDFKVKPGTVSGFGGGTASPPAEPQAQSAPAAQSGQPEAPAPAPSTTSSRPGSGYYSQDEMDSALDKLMRMK